MEMLQEIKRDLLKFDADTDYEQILETLKKFRRAGAWHETYYYARNDVLRGILHALWEDALVETHNEAFRCLACRINQTKCCYATPSGYQLSYFAHQERQHVFVRPILFGCGECLLQDRDCKLSTKGFAETGVAYLTKHGWDAPPDTAALQRSDWNDPHAPIVGWTHKEIGEQVSRRRQRTRLHVSARFELLAQAPATSQDYGPVLKSLGEMSPRGLRDQAQTLLFTIDKEVVDLKNCLLSTTSEASASGLVERLTTLTCMLLNLANDIKQRAGNGQPPYATVSEIIASAEGLEAHTVASNRAEGAR